MSIESATGFIDKIKNDGNLQGELMKVIGGALGGGSGGGLNLGALLGGGLSGESASGTGATGSGAGDGNPLLQAVVNFAKGKGFSFVTAELQKVLGGVDIAGLLGGGGIEKLLGSFGGGAGQGGQSGQSGLGGLGGLGDIASSLFKK